MENIPKEPSKKGSWGISSKCWFTEDRDLSPVQWIASKKLSLFQANELTANVIRQEK